MPSDLSLFIGVAIPEERLIRELESIVGLQIESVAFPKPGAAAFLMVLTYKEGFPLCVGLSAAELPAAPEVARKLAASCEADVLFEGEESISDTADEVWLLASASRSPVRQVRVRELNDGITVCE